MHNSPETEVVTNICRGHAFKKFSAQHYYQNIYIAEHCCSVWGRFGLCKHPPQPLVQDQKLSPKKSSVCAGTFLGKVWLRPCPVGQVHSCSGSLWPDPSPTCQHCKKWQLLNCAWIYCENQPGLCVFKPLSSLGSQTRSDECHCQVKYHLQMSVKGLPFLFSFWLLYSTYLMEAQHLLSTTWSSSGLQCFSALFCFCVAL